MNEIIFGDCRETLRRLADDGVRVQMCVTSPPYFGLRDYGVAGQLGLEPTPAEYVANMVEVFRCVRDVLADDGTLWLNIGDSYAGSWGNQGRKEDRGTQRPINGAMMQPVLDGRYPSSGSNTGSLARTPGLKNKDLIGIPWRLAFALQDDGWYLRQDIIWHKPNPMPESVRHRCTKAHEYLFLLSKSERYFYDAEAIKEPAAYPEGPGNKTQKYTQAYLEGDERMRTKAGLLGVGPREFRNRRSVWSVATRPYSGAHFATFPPALIEPCILAGTSARGHCPVCFARWARDVDRQFIAQQDVSVAKVARGAGGTKPLDASNSWQGFPRGTTRTATLGWGAGCECGAEPIADIVLDPFMGSGTTAAVAIEHGRGYLGCELNPDYAQLQQQRIDEACSAVEARIDRRVVADLFDEAAA